MEHKEMNEDRPLVIKLKEVPGAFEVTLPPDLFERVSEEQWRRVRRSICERLGYPEADIEAQEKAWGDVWRKGGD